MADTDETQTSSEECLGRVQQLSGRIGRAAVDMKYHTHIHIHIHRFFVYIHGYIHIHRCLSYVNVYPLSNYKAQLVSTVYCQYF